MFATPITTAEGMTKHASIPLPFIEEGEEYQTPADTVRNRLISNAINELREELKPLRPKLLRYMAVKATVTDITDLINCGLCHTFAALVRGHLELMGVELVLQGDPFHVWLYDPVESVHYDAHFTLGTRYREDLDGGYCADPDVGEPWTRERVSAEYTDFEFKLRSVCTLLCESNPESHFLAAESLEF